MFKNFKKKPLKVKVGIIAGILVIALLLVYVIYSNFKPADLVQYEVTKAQKGTITDSLDVNGVVTSGVTENFMAISGVTVEEVFAKVGDTVKKGDTLATFNVSGAAVYVNEAKAAYDKALKEYNDAKNTSDSNSVRKAEIEKEIKVLNLKISVKQSEIDALSKELENTTTETAPLSNEQINQVAMQMLSNGANLRQVMAFREAAKNIELPVVDEASSAKQQELLQKNIELAQLNAELSALYAENTSTMATNETILKTLKSVADAKKADYESVKSIYDKMSKGWIAENDGIITTVNIKAGEEFVPVKEANSSSVDLSSLLGGSVDADTMDMISTLLGNTSAPTGVGIVLESYEDMIVSITVGKSDLLKIKTGMKAVIKSLDAEFEGEVVYVSATATESAGGLDISSIAGSLMGGSTGSNGAEVKIKIKNPDENIVIGFDVDIKIILDTIDDVLKVPVESVIYNSGTYSVFVYDEEEGTVEKRIIKKGSLDDTSYEVLQGLEEGEMVVKSPDPNMENGTKIGIKNA